MDLTLAELLGGASRSSSDRVAIEVPGSTRWTYGRLWERAGCFASALGNHDVRAGDRVMVQIEKSPDAVALYLACIQRGLVFTPINPSCPRAELQAFIGDADPALVVVDPTGPTDLPRPTLTMGVEGDGTLAVAADAQTPLLEVEPGRPDDVAALLFTSGTTGRPKGAMITQANLVANGRALVDAWHWQPDDVLLHILPLFHVHGLFVALHCALIGASPIILVPHFDGPTVLDALPRSTVMMGVPTHYARLLDTEGFDREACRNVRLFTSGSAPMTESLHDRFTERTGHRIVERYGMTETGILTSNPYDGARVPGTVGYPLAGVELRVVDRAGRTCERGETGMIEVRGPGVCAGYWRQPDATVGPDGWFSTGDVGSQDDDGRVLLEGRAGDMIISGGENIYPKEIELMLDQIEGVTESAVIGVPDDDLGEVVVAVMVADSSPVERPALQAALDARLARFKHPKRYVWVDNLPRNTMGKVQKHRLRRDHG